jgi:ribosomal protein L37E
MQKNKKTARRCPRCGKTKAKRDFYDATNVCKECNTEWVFERKVRRDLKNKGSEYTAGRIQTLGKQLKVYKDVLRRHNESTTPNAK